MLKLFFFAGPPLTNTSKLQLHTEQLPPKSTWGLTEQLLYNQGCKETPPKSLVRRKERQSGGDQHPYWGAQKRRGEITGSGILPGE